MSSIIARNSYHSGDDFEIAFQKVLDIRALTSDLSGWTTIHRVIDLNLYFTVGNFRLSNVLHGPSGIVSLPVNLVVTRIDDSLAQYLYVEDALYFRFGNEDDGYPSTWKLLRIGGSYVHIGKTAPLQPVANRSIWIDTSVSSVAIMKIYTDTWHEIANNSVSEFAPIGVYDPTGKSLNILSYMSTAQQILNKYVDDLEAHRNNNNIHLTRDDVEYIQSLAGGDYVTEKINELLPQITQDTLALIALDENIQELAPFVEKLEEFVTHTEDLDLHPPREDIDEWKTRASNTHTHDNSTVRITWDKVVDNSGGTYDPYVVGELPEPENIPYSDTQIPTGYDGMKVTFEEGSVLDDIYTIGRSKDTIGSFKNAKYNYYDTSNYDGQDIDFVIKDNEDPDLGGTYPSYSIDKFSIDLGIEYDTVEYILSAQYNGKLYIHLIVSSADGSLKKYLCYTDFYTNNPQLVASSDVYNAILGGDVQINVSSSFIAAVGFAIYPSKHNGQLTYGEIMPDGSFDSVSLPVSPTAESKIIGYSGSYIMYDNRIVEINGDAHMLISNASNAITQFFSLYIAYNDNTYIRYQLSDNTALGPHSFSPYFPEDANILRTGSYIDGVTNEYQHALIAETNTSVLYLVIYGIFISGTFNGKTLSFPSGYVNIINGRADSISDGHIFLAIKNDGQFILSYERFYASYGTWYNAKGAMLTGELNLNGNPPVLTAVMDAESRQWYPDKARFLVASKGTSTGIIDFHTIDAYYTYKYPGKILISETPVDEAVSHTAIVPWTSYVQKEDDPIYVKLSTRKETSGEVYEHRPYVVAYSLPAGAIVIGDHVGGYYGWIYNNHFFITTDFINVIDRGILSENISESDVLTNVMTYGERLTHFTALIENNIYQWVWSGYHISQGTIYPSAGHIGTPTVMPVNIHRYNTSDLGYVYLYNNTTRKIEYISSAYVTTPVTPSSTLISSSYSIVDIAQCYHKNVYVLLLNSSGVPYIYSYNSLRLSNSGTNRASLSQTSGIGAYINTGNLYDYKMLVSTRDEIVLYTITSSRLRAGNVANTTHSQFEETFSSALLYHKEIYSYYGFLFFMQTGNVLKIRRSISGTYWESATITLPNTVAISTIFIRNDQPLIIVVQNNILYEYSLPQVMIGASNPALERLEISPKLLDIRENSFRGFPKIMVNNRWYVSTYEGTYKSDGPSFYTSNFERISTTPSDKADAIYEIQGKSGEYILWYFNSYEETDYVLFTTDFITYKEISMLNIAGLGGTSGDVSISEIVWYPAISNYVMTYEFSSDEYVLRTPSLTSATVTWSVVGSPLQNISHSGTASASLMSWSTSTTTKYPIFPMYDTVNDRSVIIRVTGTNSYSTHTYTDPPFDFDEYTRLSQSIISPTKISVLDGDAREKDDRERLILSSTLSDVSINTDYTIDIDYSYDDVVYSSHEQPVAIVYTFDSVTYRETYNLRRNLTTTSGSLSDNARIARIPEFYNDMQNIITASNMLFPKYGTYTLVGIDLPYFMHVQIGKASNGHRIKIGLPYRGRIAKALLSTVTSGLTLYTYYHIISVKYDKSLGALIVSGLSRERIYIIETDDINAAGFAVTSLTSYIRYVTASLAGTASSHKIYPRADGSYLHLWTTGTTTITFYMGIGTLTAPTQYASMSLGTGFVSGSANSIVYASNGIDEAVVVTTGSTYKSFWAFKLSSAGNSFSTYNSTPHPDTTNTPTFLEYFSGYDYQNAQNPGSIYIGHTDTGIVWQIRVPSSYQPVLTKSHVLGTTASDSVSIEQSQIIEYNGILLLPEAGAGTVFSSIDGIRWYQNRLSESLDTGNAFSALSVTDGRMFMANTSSSWSATIESYIPGPVSTLTENTIPVLISSHSDNTSEHIDLPEALVPALPNTSLYKLTANSKDYLVMYFDETGVYYIDGDKLRKGQMSSIELTKITTPLTYPTFTANRRITGNLGRNDMIFLNDNKLLRMGASGFEIVDRTLQPRTFNTESNSTTVIPNGASVGYTTYDEVGNQSYTTASKFTTADDTVYPIYCNGFYYIIDRYYLYTTFYDIATWSEKALDSSELDDFDIFTRITDTITSTGRVKAINHNGVEYGYDTVFGTSQNIIAYEYDYMVIFIIKDSSGVNRAYYNNTPDPKVLIPITNLGQDVIDHMVANVDTKYERTVNPDRSNRPTYIMDDKIITFEPYGPDKIYPTISSNPSLGQSTDNTPLIKENLLPRLDSFGVLRDNNTVQASINKYNKYIVSTKLFGDVENTAIDYNKSN